MENNRNNKVNVNNSSINTIQKRALSKFLICSNKEQLIELINDIMMMDFIDKESEDRREDLIILLMFLEEL